MVSVSVRDRMRMFEKAKDGETPQSPSSIKRRESGRSFKATGPSSQAKQQPESPRWRVPDAIPSPSQQGTTDARYSSPFLPTSNETQKPSPRQNFSSPRNASPKNASPRMQTGANDSADSSEQIPSPHQRSSNKDRFSFGQQQDKKKWPSSPYQQTMPPSPAASLASVRSSITNAQQKISSDSSVAAKAKSDSSWLGRNTSSDEEIVEPRKSFGKDPIRKVSSSFLLPPQPSSVSTTPRPSPVVLPTKSGAKKEIPFKLIHNQESKTPATSSPVVGDQDISNTRAWQPSPRDLDKGREGSEESVSSTRKQETPSYRRKDIKSRPPSSNSDTDEGREEVTERKIQSRKLEENEELEVREQPQPLKPSSSFSSVRDTKQEPSVPQPLKSSSSFASIRGAKKEQSVQDDSSTEETNRSKGSRAARLTALPKKAEIRSSWGSSYGSKLKESLIAAKDVMEEERSNAGSSDASSRSSLSNMELGDIANRALNMSKDKAGKPKHPPKPALLPSYRATKVAHPSTSPKGKDSMSVASHESKQSSKFSRAALLSHALKRAAAHESVRTVQGKERPQSQATTQTAAIEKKPEAPSPKNYREKSIPVNKTARDTASSEPNKTNRQTTSTKQQTSRWTRASSMENRRAILSAAQKQKGIVKSDKKQEKIEDEKNQPESIVSENTEKVGHQKVKKETNEVAARLGFKASRVLAMKNSTRVLNNTRAGGKVSPTPPFEDYEIQTADSTISGLTTDSTRSRRTSHPALVARAASPRPEAMIPHQQKQESSNIATNEGDDKAANKKTHATSQKPFSEELFSSFRHFNAARKTTTEVEDRNQYPQVSSFDQGRATPEPVELRKASSYAQPGTPSGAQDIGRPPQHGSTTPLKDLLHVQNVSCTPASSFDQVRSTANTVDLTCSGTMSDRGRPPQYGSSSVASGAPNVELHVSLTSDDGEKKAIEVTVPDIKAVESDTIPSFSFSDTPIKSALSDSKQSFTFSRTPKSLRDALALAQSTPGSRQETEMLEGRDSRDDGACERYIQDSPMSADRSASHSSSPFVEQEDSLHSTSERNYLENFYDMGRSRYTSKQGFQEAPYLSSLSSATFAPTPNQSIVSMDEKRKASKFGPSKSSEFFANPSPMSFNHQQQTQFAFRVEPVEEVGFPGSELPPAKSPGPSLRSTTGRSIAMSPGTSLRSSMRSGHSIAMSPGPSMRSAHSLAQSIISVSPREENQNPEFDYYSKASPGNPFREDVEPFETLQEFDDEDNSKASESSRIKESGQDGNANKSTPLDAPATQNQQTQPEAPCNVQLNSMETAPKTIINLATGNQQKLPETPKVQFANVNLSKKGQEPPPKKSQLQGEKSPFNLIAKREPTTIEKRELTTISLDPHNEMRPRTPMLEPPEGAGDGVQKSVAKQNIGTAPLSTSHHSHSSSPPGFVFGETEKEEKVIPDPDGAPPDPFVFSDDLFGDFDDDDFFPAAMKKVTVVKKESTKKGFEQADDGFKLITSNADHSFKLTSHADDGFELPHAPCEDSKDSKKEAPVSTQKLTGPAKDLDGPHKDRSHSTKETSTSTVSTSLRSGLSSIQNAAALTSSFGDDVFTGTDASPLNGSTSMRTGLSSIQIQTADPPEADDIEASSSTRNGLPPQATTKAVSPKVPDASESSGVTDIQSQKSSSLHNSHHFSQRSAKVPDTIIEEEDENSGILNTRSNPGSVAKEVVQSSGQSADPTASMSSGSTSQPPPQAQSLPKQQSHPKSKPQQKPQPKAQPTPKTHPTPIVQPTPKAQPTPKLQPQSQQLQSKSIPVTPQSLQKPQTYEATSDLKGIEASGDTETVALSRIVTQDDTILDASHISEAASSKQSWWKKKKAGMKMPNVIKQVLSKASPRHGLLPSPMGRGQRHQAGFSSDEEESIFGGLEEDNTMEEGKKKHSLSNSKVSRSQHSHSRKTETKSNSTVEDRTNTTTKHSLLNSSNEGQQMTMKKPLKASAIDTKSRSNRDVIEKAAAKLKKLQPQPPHPSSPLATATNANNSLYTIPNSLYSNDRSGTVVDESEVLEGVNSDITSSLLAGSGPGMQKPGLKSKKKSSGKLKVDESVKKGQRKQPKTPKTPKTPTPKTPKTPKTPTAKSKVKNISSSSRTKSSTTSLTEALDKLEDEDDDTLFQTQPKTPKSKSKKKPREEDKVGEKSDDEENSAAESEPNEPDSPKAPSASIFMNFGCGFVDSWASTMTNACNFGSKVDLSEDVIGEDDGFGSITSSHSQSQLTDLEKRIWNEWDNLDASASKTTNNDELSEVDKEKQEKQEKKREAARGKLLQIAGSAISSHMSVTKEEDDERGLSSDYTGSTESTVTGESSGVSGESGMSSTSSGPIESQSYYSGNTESDYTPTSPSSRKEEEQTVAEPSITPSTTPILLSFSQKSLVEKFTKQLAKDGVQVLKLNTRKQWQVRYFTVSKEKIALTAHAANSTAKNVAQCPNALLWLKKFNSKNGGYSISNIDKTGHGGMMLVDLVDVHVSTQADKDHPIPKKLKDKYKEPVLLTLDYVMEISGVKENRSIEFCCKDNDEAQFLCTCMRVIRDLLKREESLRIKNYSSAKI